MLDSIVGPENEEISGGAVDGKACGGLNSWESNSCHMLASDIPGGYLAEKCPLGTDQTRGA